MPSFFTFQQGSESRSGNDSSPLLGRFRAVPDERAPNRRHRNSLLGTWRGGYGTVFGNSSTSLVDGEEDGGEWDQDDGLGWVRRLGRHLRDLWLEPKQAAVGRAVERWWSRWWVLVGLPAVLVSCGAFLVREMRSVGICADEFEC